jgi:AAA domain
MAEHTTGTATSRARSLRPATRKATKARLAISGPSGSGKTWTALSIAEVLAPGGRYAVIDTEPSDDNNSAAELYADRFAFETIDWTQPPWDPRDLTLTIKELGDEGLDVLIVDSGSAFWRGQGGTLDIAGGRFGGWRTATPAQDALVQSILRAPMHMIFCTRAKQAYTVEEGRDGKQTVHKLGLEPIQRDDLEYEFQVVASIDIDHRIDIGKTRCADLAGLSFVANDQANLATIYRDWLARGLRLVTQTDADLLGDAFNAIGNAEERQKRKAAFVGTLGCKPTELDVERLEEAWVLAATLTGVLVHPFTPGEAEDSVCSLCSLGRRAGWHDAAAQAEDAPKATRGRKKPDAAPAPEKATEEPETELCTGCGALIDEAAGDEVWYDEGGEPYHMEHRPPPDAEDDASDASDGFAA